VIVESPTKARTISRFLGNDVTVVASMGHIVELIDKKMDLLVANNFVPQYEVAEGKNNVVRELKSLSKQANRIILATDEDREGEAIAWHLCQQLKIDPTTTDRIVFHEITESAILEALSSPRKVDMPLVQAQQARAVLDKLV
jgi:DNA topoisomerase-1